MDKTTTGFDALIDLFNKYVEHQKGVWDYSAWVDFLFEVQKIGFRLNDEMITYLGSMLDSTKSLYDATTATEGIQHSVIDIYVLAFNFFLKTRGVYKPEEWEAFIEELQGKGINLTEETRSYIMNAFESAFDLSNKAFASFIGGGDPKKSPERPDKE